MKCSLHRRAFTLVEVVIIVAVTASVLALVAPIYSAKQDRDMGNRCLDNLKKQAAAMKLYGADWDGRYPWAFEWNNPGQKNLYDCLLPYVPDGDSAFRCPADVGDVTAPTWGNPGVPFWKTFDTSYNWPGVNYIGMFPHLAGLKQSNPVISNPPASQKAVWDLPLSKRIMIFDGRPWHRRVAVKPVSWTEDQSSVCNVAFCDGHVGPMNYRVALTYLGLLPSTGPL